MYIYISVLIILIIYNIVRVPQYNQVIQYQPVIKEEKRTHIIIPIGLLYITMVLKEPITGDYSRYAYYFLGSSYKTLSQMAANKGEWGFHLLTKMIRFVTDNPNLYFTITSLIVCMSTGYFISKYAESKKLAIYFYYTIGLFAFSLAGLRQVLAMSICLFAYQAIKEQKLLKFVLIVGVASLFHKSAIIFMPAYFIARIQWTRNQIIIISFIYGTVCLFFGKIYSSFADWLGYDSYGIESTGNGGIFFVILLCISVLCFIYRKDLIKQDEFNRIVINLHFVVVAIWFFRLFTRTLERPAYYYIYATILLLDRVFSLKFKSIDKERTLKAIAYLAMFLFGVFFVYRLSRDINLIPYDFVW